MKYKYVISRREIQIIGIKILESVKEVLTKEIELKKVNLCSFLR